jgi:hypothetical protein
MPTVAGIAAVLSRHQTSLDKLPPEPDRGAWLPARVGALGTRPRAELPMVWGL